MEQLFFLDADFFADRKHWENVADRIVYTGKIDEFYDYRFGYLEYRTVRFSQKTLDTPNYQGNAVVNYTDREIPYTRIIEHNEKLGYTVHRSNISACETDISTCCFLIA